MMRNVLAQNRSLIEIKLATLIEIQWSGLVNGGKREIEGANLGYPHSLFLIPNISGEEN